MLFPGESAPVHAHSISAIRFGLAGSGALMIIDGDRVPMEPGDLILTPGWSWHGHVHPGGDEPVVWMDGLDVPFVLGLRAGFMRDDPYSGDPLPVRDTTGTAAGTAGTAALLPAGTRHGQHSPVRRYPWDQAYPALRRLMARSPGRDTPASLEYRNPLTGGPALATLGCLLQGMPVGAQTLVRSKIAIGSEWRLVATKLVRVPSRVGWRGGYGGRGAGGVRECAARPPCRVAAFSA